MHSYSTPNRLKPKRVFCRIRDPHHSRWTNWVVGYLARMHVMLWHLFFFMQSKVGDWYRTGKIWSSEHLPKVVLLVPFGSWPLALTAGTPHTDCWLLRNQLETSKGSYSTSTSRLHAPWFCFKLPVCCDIASEKQRRFTAAVLLCLHSSCLIPATSDYSLRRQTSRQGCASIEWPKSAQLRPQ